MTSSERAAVIAEKVMVWKRHGLGWWPKNGDDVVWVDRYKPDHNIAQAFEALEKWVGGGPSRSADIEVWPNETIVTLRVVIPATKNRFASRRTVANQPSSTTSEAIVSALVEAVGDE